jgi:hypothetical protein
MKIKFVAFLLFILLFKFNSNAQNVVGDIPGKGLDIQTNPQGFVSQLPPAPAEIQGNYYLTDEWSLGTIYLDKIKLENYYIRYDIKLNQFELKAGNSIKVLDGKRVKNFSIQNIAKAITDEYINAKDFTLNNVALTGFLKIITDGRWKLLSRTETKFIKSGYVSALDAGEKNDQITKTEKFYVANGSVLIDAKMLKKKNYQELFSKESEETQKSIASSNFNTKNVLDLSRLVNLLNASTLN